MPMRRHIPLDKTFNTRDTGGYRARDGRYTRWGALFRTDCPYSLSAESQAEIDRLGLKTSLDLRNAQELAFEAEQSAFRRMPGIQYVNEPLMLRFGNDTMADWLGDTYLRYVDKHRDRVRVLLGVIAKEPWPLIVNCQAGKDRTGMVIALVLALAGVNEDDIIADYALTAVYGEGLTPYLIADAQAKGFDSPRYRRMLEIRPDAVRHAFDWIRANFGDMENYAQAIGVTDEETAAIREKLLIERAQVEFGWRLPDERRARTPFIAEVHAHEASLDRWLMRLIEPASALDATLPEDFRARIEGLAGRWVRVPGEARAHNLALPMKYETLLGEIAYFHEDKPAVAP